MKVLTLFTFIYFFCYHISIAQQIDIVELQCRYNLEYSKNKLSLDSKQVAIMTLNIGKKHSVFYSEDYWAKDSAMYVDMQVAPHLILGNTKKYTSKDPGYWICKSYTTPQKYIYCTKMIEDNYEYVENIPNFNWIITDDRTQILGYQCQKAICSYAVRDYVAWFAPEIASSDGPWKFYGLPGLILHIHDTQNQYSFECIEIRAVNGTLHISKATRDYLQVDCATLTDMENRFMQAPISYINSTTGVSVKRMDAGKTDFVYNPIELNSTK